MIASPSPWERTLAALRGQTLDRPARSLWRHFYDREVTAEGLAAAMLEWQASYGFDFLKVNPRAHYHVEGWGARYAYSGLPFEKPRRLDYPVHQPSDWARIQPLDPEAGALGEQLTALRLVRQGLGASVPFIETVFSPLMVAGYLVGSDEQLLHDLREEPGAVHAALEAITETFAAFAAACLREGVAGAVLRHHLGDAAQADRRGVRNLRPAVRSACARRRPERLAQRAPCLRS